jgi:arylsulfatase A-like enzyme
MYDDRMMERREFLRGLLPGGRGRAQEPPKRPNILLFCTDQQRFDTIGALAIRIGLPTSIAWCATAWPSPAPIARPHLHAQPRLVSTDATPAPCVNHNGNEFSRPSTCPLMSRILKDAGYDCGMVGVSPRQEPPARDQARRRFRLFEWSHAPRATGPSTGRLTCAGCATADRLQDCTARALPDRREFNAGMAASITKSSGAAKPRAHGSRAVSGRLVHPREHLRAASAVRSAPEWLKRMDPASMPLPLWGPREAEAQAPFARVDFQSKPRDPRTYPARFMKAAYYAQIEFIDHHAGLILDLLEKTGQRENTMIVFMSDHGESMGDHGLTHKGCRFYEGLAHVPLIFSWPAGMRKRALAALVENTDILPTMLDALASPCPPTCRAVRFTASRPARRTQASTASS